MKTVAYYTTGKTESVNPECHVRSLRVWRFELCCAWLNGALPSVFYARFNGKLHPGALSTTLRAGRVMVGYRWYEKGTR